MFNLKRASGPSLSMTTFLSADPKKEHPRVSRLVRNHEFPGCPQLDRHLRREPMRETASNTTTHQHLTTIPVLATHHLLVVVSNASHPCCSTSIHLDSFHLHPSPPNRPRDFITRVNEHRRT